MKPNRKFLPEEELVSALKKHDELAMEVLYHMYSGALLGVISRIVKEHETAEDILQETFLKIWNSAAQYNNSKGRLFTWMLNIARNQSIDMLRSKDYRKQSRCTEIDDNRAIIDLKHQVGFNTDTIGIRELVSQLQPEYRSLLEITYYKGYVHTATAEVLKMPVGTVKTRIRYAILQLRASFN